MVVDGPVAGAAGQGESGWHMLFLTSTECRAIAERKLAEAGHDERHRKRLVNAAEGWLFLAGQLRRIEKSFGDDGFEKML
jgi:hypothetical protein